MCTHDPLWSGNVPALGGTRRGAAAGAEDQVLLASSGLYVWDGDWVDDVRSDVRSDVSAEDEVNDSMVEGIAVPHRGWPWQTKGGQLAADASVPDSHHVHARYQVVRGRADA